MIKLSLPATIASILGKREHEDYQDVGHKMSVKDLYKLLGLTGSPMLYNYMSGKTKSIEAERAVVIHDKFGILVDHWNSAEELKQDATNTELSEQIAREPLKEIINDIVELEANEDVYSLRKGLRRIIARYY